jgi:hypothetical protein
VRTTGSTGGFDFFFCRLRNRIHAATRAIIATAPAATPAPAAAPGETSPPDEVVGVEGIWVLVEAGVLLATDVEVEVVEKVKEDEIEGELEVWEIEADVYANPVAAITKKVAISLGAGRLNVSFDGLVQSTTPGAPTQHAQRSVLGLKTTSVADLSTDRQRCDVSYIPYVQVQRKVLFLCVTYNISSCS